MPITTRQKARKKKSSAISSSAAADSDVQRISNSEVDNSLLGFDAVSNSMMDSGHDRHNNNNHLMPTMNIDSGSLGTRSPSPSDISDPSSLGSKRSRTELDDDNMEDNNHNNSAKKRAPIPSAPGSAPMDFRRTDRAQGGASPAVMIRMDREREGRCPDCGLETHSVVRRNDGSFVREPLNIEGEVFNGRCLFCNPIDDVGSDTSSQQFIQNVQHSRLSPITSSAHWPSGHNMKQSPARRKHSPTDHARLTPGKNGPVNMYQSNNKMSPQNNLWQQRRNGAGDLSVSSVSCSGGLDTVDSQSVLTGESDGSHRSGLSQNSGGMGKLGKSIALGMGMSGGRETPRQQQHQQRNRAPDPPTLKAIPSKSPKLDTDTPTSMNSRAIVRKHSSEEDVQRAVVIAHSKLPSSIYHHHMYPLENGAEQAFIEKTRLYLESGSADICDIIVAMRRFPFSLSIQSVACEKLYVHCFERDHAHAIGLAGGVRTIIDAMEHHPNDVALQHTCAGMIKHLACASPYNLDMLDRMGAVGILMATMECHSQNALLLEACCWAIEGMARVHSPEFKMKVARCGGIHAAMKAVEAFPDNDALLRAAFHCLRQLGYNPSSFGYQQQQQMGSIPQNFPMDNGNQT